MDQELACETESYTCSSHGQDKNKIARGYIMKIASNLLIKYVIPIIILYLAFTYLGILGGVVVAALYFCFLNLSVIIQNIAGRKYSSGDYDGALKLTERSLKLNPGNFRTRGTYAFLLLKLGNITEAAGQIDQALSDCYKGIERNSLEVTKALVVWKQGDTDKAIAILEEVMKSFKNTSIYGTLGFLYIEKGDLEKALSFNLEAYDYNATNPIILDNLGCTRYLRNEYDEALPIYKQLMKSKPGFPVAFFNYARVLEHFGKLDEAAYMCRYALTLKFWITSTITREEVEEKLNELESAIKVQEETAPRKIAENDQNSTNPDQAADIL